MLLHIVIAVSSHGFGHLGQTAPVVQALKRRFPDLRVTLRTTLPELKLRERFDFDIEIQRVEIDVGLVQTDAFNVRIEESARAYAAFHQNWQGRISTETDALTELGANLVLANVPYLPLAGAAHAGIPALAFCSLNWAEVYRHFLSDRVGGDRIVREMLAAYNQAECFLQPEPSIPMPGLDNVMRIGPVAQMGNNRREELTGTLRLSDEERLLLVSLGGMDHRLPVENWPPLPGIRLLLPRRWRVSHPQAIDLESLDMPFIDVLTSCDALITKTGYGSLVEAACAGAAVLYVERNDWMETPILADWLKSHGRCLALDLKRLRRGDIAESLNELLSQPAPPPVAPTGIDQAVEVCLRLLES